MRRLRAWIAILSLAVMASCTDAGHEGRVAQSSTTSTSTSTRPAPAEHAVLRAQYTCGPADGAYITARVRTGRTMPVMSELVVAGVGTVRLYEGDAQGGTPRLLTSEPVVLRLPPGVGCG